MFASENSRLSLKLEKISTNRKTPCVHEFQDLILSRWLYSLDRSVQLRLYQDPAGFISEVDRLIIKFMQKYIRSEITKDILRKSKMEGSHSDLKIWQSNNRITERTLSWHESRYSVSGQQRLSVSLRSHYIQPIFYKDAKSILGRRKSLFNKWSRKN